MIAPLTYGEWMRRLYSAHYTFSNVEQVIHEAWKLGAAEMQERCAKIADGMDHDDMDFRGIATAIRSMEEPK